MPSIYGVHTEREISSMWTHLDVGVNSMWTSTQKLETTCIIRSSPNAKKLAF